MKLVPAEKYYYETKRLISAHPDSCSRVFSVTSDSEAAIQACRVLSENSKWDYVYSKIPRMPSGFHLQHLRSVPKKGQMIYTHLLQLLMSLESDAWVTGIDWLMNWGVYGLISAMESLLKSVILKMGITNGDFLQMWAMSKISSRISSLVLLHFLLQEVLHELNETGRKQLMIQNKR